MRQCGKELWRRFLVCMLAVGVLISVANACDCVGDVLLVFMYMCWLYRMLVLFHCKISVVLAYCIYTHTLARTHIHAHTCSLGEVYRPFGKYLVVVLVFHLLNMFKWNRNTIYIDTKTWESKYSCEWQCRHSVSACGMVSNMYTG